MRHRTLYTQDQDGRLRSWYAEVDDEHPSRWRTVSGLVGGQLIATAWTQCLGKNEGRSNATTAEEQCILDVGSAYRHRLDRRYYETQKEALDAPPGGHRYFGPMLAHKWRGWEKDGPAEGRTAYVQPKLDGFRCIASVGGLRSRQGKPFNLPHIVQALSEVFSNDEDFVLDGELYNHGLRNNFEELASLIKKGNRTEEEEYRVRHWVQYHIYDMPSVPESFRVRIGHLHTFYGYAGMLENGVYGPLHLVSTYEVATEGQLRVKAAGFLAQGYEGAMVRLDAPYDLGKRSRRLLKVKEFDSLEFRLVRVEEGEGNWSGYAKSVVIALEDGSEQDSGMRGSYEFARRILEEWPKYRRVTVRHQGRTEAGRLRFPVVTNWHED